MSTQGQRKRRRAAELRNSWPLSRPYGELEREFAKRKLQVLKALPVELEHAPPRVLEGDEEAKQAIYREARKACLRYGRNPPTPPRKKVPKHITDEIVREVARHARELGALQGRK